VAGRGAGPCWRRPEVARFDPVIDELALASLLLSAFAVISCLSVEDKRRIRLLPRALWMIIILLVPLAGGVAWFAAGRPRTLRLRRSGWRAAFRLPEPAGPPAPDDDPTFLRSLGLPDDRPGSEEPQPGPDPPPNR